MLPNDLNFVITFTASLPVARKSAFSLKKEFESVALGRRRKLDWQLCTKKASSWKQTRWSVIFFKLARKKWWYSSQLKKNGSWTRYRVLKSVARWHHNEFDTSHPSAFGYLFLRLISLFSSFHGYWKKIQLVLSDHVLANLISFLDQFYSGRHGLYEIKCHGSLLKPIENRVARQNLT